jgi:hypothetical protein
MLVKSRIKLPRSDLALFQFILESYEGIFSISTEDAHLASLSITVPSGLWEDGRKILQELKKEISWEEI